MGYFVPPMVMRADEKIFEEFPEHPYDAPWTDEMRNRWFELVEGDYPYQAVLKIGATNPRAVTDAGIVTGDFIYFPPPNGAEAIWGFLTREELQTFCDHTGARRL